MPVERPALARGWCYAAQSMSFRVLASRTSSAPPSGGIARGGRVAAYPAERKHASEIEKEHERHEHSRCPQATANRVLIFDTTLRDGEQSPGISLERAEKLEIAQQLARLGVDVIEAGFPIASPGDFESVEAIAREVEGPVICGLARTSKQDIDAAWDAVRDAERPRIHMFIATSRHPHRAQAADDARGGQGPGRARPSRRRKALHRRRRVLARGRLALRRRLHGRGDARSRSTRARPRSTSPTPSATRCRDEYARCS